MPKILLALVRWFEKRNWTECCPIGDTDSGCASISRSRLDIWRPVGEYRSPCRGTLSVFSCIHCIWKWRLVFKVCCQPKRGGDTWQSNVQNEYCWIPRCSCIKWCNAHSNGKMQELLEAVSFKLQNKAHRKNVEHRCKSQAANLKHNCWSSRTLEW